MSILSTISFDAAPFSVRLIENQNLSHASKIGMRLQGGGVLSLPFAMSQSCPWAPICSVSHPILEAVDSRQSEVWLGLGHWMPLAVCCWECWKAQPPSTATPKTSSDRGLDSLHVGGLCKSHWCCPWNGPMRSQEY